MAVCEYCRRDMTSPMHPGCVMRFVHFSDGVVLPRELKNYQTSMHYCHDCGALIGRQHHPNCDMERCPRCEGQLLSCRCPQVAGYSVDGTPDFAVLR